MLGVLCVLDLRLEGWSSELHHRRSFLASASLGALTALGSLRCQELDSFAARRKLISDVDSQDQMALICHLENISMRAGRLLQWNMIREQFIDDSDANTWLRREQRSGYEVV